MNNNHHVPSVTPAPLELPTWESSRLPKEFSICPRRHPKTRSLSPASLRREEVNFHKFWLVVSGQFSSSPSHSFLFFTPWLYWVTTHTHPCFLFKLSSHFCTNPGWVHFMIDTFPYFSVLLTEVCPNYFTWCPALYIFGLEKLTKQSWKWVMVHSL